MRAQAPPRRATPRRERPAVHVPTQSMGTRNDPVGLQVISGVFMARFIRVRDSFTRQRLKRQIAVAWFSFDKGD